MDGGSRSSLLQQCEALDDATVDLRQLVGKRELAMRKFEDMMATNMREEGNVIRKLEHRVAILRTMDRDSMCASCKKRSKVHQQYSNEIVNAILMNGAEKKKESKAYSSSNNRKKLLTFVETRDFGQQWNGFDPDRSMTDTEEEEAGAEASGAAGAPLSADEGDFERKSQTVSGPLLPKSALIDLDLETRLRILNEKVDDVATKTSCMLNKSCSLNEASKVLKDQVVSIQRGVRRAQQLNKY